MSAAHPSPRVVMKIRNFSKHPHSTALRAMLSGLLTLFVSTALFSADNTPTRHEFWVPSQHWKTVLAKHPGAVMLTPEQYEALIRDAGRIEAPKPDENLPAAALVEGLHFKGSAVDENAGFLKLDGEMTLRCLTDEWTEVTARMPFRNLTSATVDGSVVLGLPEGVSGDQTGATQRKLLVRGKGVHHITMQVLGRPGSSGLALTRRLGFQTVDVPAVLDLQLPPAAVITFATASYTREGDLAHILLHSATGGLRDLAWTTGGAISEAARETRASGATTVTDHSIETAWELDIQRSVADSTNKIAFEVVPPEALVLSVEGDGVTLWQQNGGKLDVTLRDHTAALTLRARVQGALDLQTSATAQSVALPTLRFAGQMVKDAESRIAGIAEGVTLMEYQGATPSPQGVLTWNPVRATLKLLLRKADPRVVVDADAHITVTRDDVEIERTLTVQTDRPINELRVTLPKGEEFLSTASTQGPSLDWKRVGQVIEYGWSQALAGGQPCSLKLQTRKRLNPGGDASATSHALTVESLTIPEARKLAGYIALDFDPTWRVAIQAVAGLEERDARITPVQGKMAWFGLRSYSLGFEVKRREPVFDADVTAYALPRAKTVEIEGQITLNVSDAPLRQFKVAVARESAARVRFTSPLVGEQTLDAKSGVWSLALRKESLGRIPLRFRLSLPGSPDASVKSAAEVITALLPTISVNSVRRQRGVWVVEANTDTELTFDAKIMQPLDVLRAPAIEDYQPRHRVVAAFDYATPEATLTLHAARHGHSELAALVVNEMSLTSVLSHDGSARHEVVLDVHHSGEQFINIALPPGSQLLTALADGSPVKPVRGPEGAISIPLPADSANQPSVPVRLLYETTGATWTASGQRHLVPPTLPGNISILATDWQVFAPDGYSFKKVKTEMEQEGTGLVVQREPAAVRDEPIVPELPVSTAKINLPKLEYRTGPASTLVPVHNLVEAGDKAYAAGDYQTASNQYNEALEFIPAAPATQEWRRLVQAKYADACVALAQEWAKLGRYKDSRELIQYALNTVPNHRGALTLRRRLEDPDRYPPVLSPEHLRRVQEVESNLQKGRSYKELGDYDNALKAYREVLRDDPYNIAARRGMESIEKRKNNYYNAARDHQRAQMLSQVDEAWEETIPSQDEASKMRSLAVMQKLKAIRIPKVAFSGATIEQALEYLAAKSKELDTDGDPARRGVKILLKAGDTRSDAQISLDLKDVPMDEALRYVTELAGMKYTVKSDTVMVVPITESTTEFETRTYRAPRDFLTRGEDSGTNPPTDPFGTPAPGVKKESPPRGNKTAKEILAEQGIPFPEGAVAVFEPSNRRLVVRNTAANLDMVEAVAGIEPLYPKPQSAIKPSSNDPGSVTYLRQKMKSIRFPQVTFSGATIEEAIEYLRMKSKDLDTDAEPSLRGLNFIVKSGDTPSGGNISLDLKDVPMEEALRYITELAGMKYVVEPYAVLIVPITESTTEMVTRIFKVPPNLLTWTDSFAKPGATTSKLPLKKSAREILAESGMPFPEGASAVFNPVTNQLVVRDTAENIELVEKWVDEMMAKHGLPDEQEFATKAGLLTLDLDIPTEGQRLHFHGPQAPTELTLSYVSWDRQIVYALLLMLAGAALFLAWGRRRPVLATLLVMLVLALGVGLITEEWQALANAALVGWLGALALTVVWKLVKAFEAGVVEGRRA